MAATAVIAQGSIRSGCAESASARGRAACGEASSPARTRGLSRRATPRTRRARRRRGPNRGVAHGFVDSIAAFMSCPIAPLPAPPLLHGVGSSAASRRLDSSSARSLGSRCSSHLLACTKWPSCRSAEPSGKFAPGVAKCGRSEVRSGGQTIAVAHGSTQHPQPITAARTWDRRSEWVRRSPWDRRSKWVRRSP